MTVGFLGGAQIDRFANLNTTVVGPYDKPKVRLPGGGGAPEIATACGEIFIIMRQSKRSFVDKLDFITSMGHGEGGDHRARLGLKTKGPTKLITDLCDLRARSGDQGNDRDVDPSRRDARADRGEHRLAGALCGERRRDAGADGDELQVLRDLHARTARPRRGGVRARTRPEGARGGGASNMRAFICDECRSLHLRWDAHADRPLRRRARQGAHRRSRGGADQGADGAQSEASTGRRSTRSISAAPTRPARTTAMSRAWRCCSPGCRTRCRASP